MSDSIKKSYPDGNKLNVWRNTAGISMGLREISEEKAHPFLSFYSRKNGGYVLVVRREELEKHKILLEIE